METLMGKVAVITGASAGIGAATAHLFAKHGCSMVLTGRNRERLEKVADECQQIGLKKDQVVPVVVTDIAVEEQVRDLAKTANDRFSKINILVNNAAMFVGSRSFENSSIENVDLFWRINVRSPILLTQLLLPKLKENKGSVINIASMVGVQGWPVAFEYSLAKGAMNHMTKCMAVSMPTSGVRFNSVSPGFIRTQVLDPFPDPEEMWKTIEANNASGRVGTSEEVANLIGFLASDAAPYINGANMVIDGAETITMKLTKAFEAK